MSKSKLYAVEPGGLPQLSAERAMIQNSAAYMMNLHEVENCCQLPDGVTSSVPMKHRYSFELNLIEDSVVTTDKYALVVIQPNMLDQIGTSTAFANGLPTMTYADDPNTTGFTTNFYYFRINAISARFSNTGSQLNRGCTVIIGQAPIYLNTSTGAPPWLQDVGPTPDEWSTFRDNWVTSSGDCCDFTLSWIPGLFGAGTLGATAAGSEYCMGTDMRRVNMAADGIVDTVPFAVFQTVDAATDKWIVEVTVNYEFVVGYGNSWLFRPVFAIGSRHTVALVFAEICMRYPALHAINHYQRTMVIQQVAAWVHKNATGGGSFASFVRKNAKKAANALKKFLKKQVSEFEDHPVQTIMKGVGIARGLLAAPAPQSSSDDDSASVGEASEFVKIKISPKHR